MKLSSAITGLCLTLGFITTQARSSSVEAYNAGDEVHLVIAAPISSQVEQKLWVCKGTKVLDGTRKYGYLISIGKGAGRFTRIAAQTLENRNRNGSNLTPLGEMRISRKIDSTCGRGMLKRCMQLDGVEKRINDETIHREIYIHGTPTTNYANLGKSASHGCVRMHQKQVVEIYDLVEVGTKVYVNSRAVSDGNPCNFIGDEEGKAR